MKYYNIELSFFNYNEEEKGITSKANGEKIANSNFYFDRMDDGEIIQDAPIFDSFFLENFDKKKYWERYLLDVHGFIGKGSQIQGWFVSEDFKDLLNNFILQESIHFYPSKLLYKEKKKDYYIFQYGGGQIIPNIKRKFINWTKSVFTDLLNKQNLPINNLDEFIDKYYDKLITPEKFILKHKFDFFHLYIDNYATHIVSDLLKQAIEDMGITGFRFSELPYEVVIDQP